MRYINKPFLGHGLELGCRGQNVILNIPNTKDQIKGGIPLHPHNNFLEIWLELGFRINPTYSKNIISALTFNYIFLYNFFTCP